LKNKLKVKFVYPWIFPDSPYYKFLFDFKPKNIIYTNPIINSRDVATKKNKLKNVNNLKSNLRKIIFTSGIPLPNCRIAKTKNIDLLHCAHCLTYSNIPWIADFEVGWQLTLSRIDNKLGIKLAKFFIKNKNCKKLICWTKQVKKDIIKYTENDNEIKKKLTVIYPAVPLQKKVNQNTKKIRLLFVARYFESKGGELALEMMEKLTKKNSNVEGLIVSEVSKELKEKYKENKKIKFYDLMPRDKLFKDIYPKSNIFIYPGLSDTFGFSFLEAMSFGLPIITISGIARDELVENNKNGYIIKSKININKLNNLNNKNLIKEMTKKTQILIDNSKKRTEFGNFGHNLIKKGKFSIKERNKKMEKVYFEAVGE
jgi:glycosyltransferase involved in cell wall biosynthesis